MLLVIYGFFSGPNSDRGDAESAIGFWSRQSMALLEISLGPSSLLRPSESCCISLYPVVFPEDPAFCAIRVTVSAADRHAQAWCSH